jgi:hypothetical protein
VESLTSGFITGVSSVILPFLFRVFVWLYSILLVVDFRTFFFHVQGFVANLVQRH